MVTSFNTIFIPATPQAYRSLQQKDIRPMATSFGSYQFLHHHFPNLSTVRMAEFAANVVSYLWTVPNSVDNTSGQIPKCSTPRLKEAYSDILLSLEQPTVVVILALKYMHRLRVSLRYTKLEHAHMTRIFVACLLVASKYHMDVKTRNIEWSAKVGIFVSDLSVIERWLLEQFDYDLGISYEDFFLWIKWLSDSWIQSEIDCEKPKQSLGTFQALQRIQQASRYGGLNAVSDISLLASLTTLPRLYPN